MESIFVDRADPIRYPIFNAGQKPAEFNPILEECKATKASPP